MLQQLFDPDPRRLGRRYVIWTDWTFALRIKHNKQDREILELNSSSELFRFEAQVAQRAAHVFAYNSVCRDSFIDDYGLDPAKVSVLAPPSRMISPEPHPPFTELKPTALFVGIDFHRKGGDILLKAWPAVRAAIPNARLIICGPNRIPHLPDGVEMRGPQSRAEIQQAFLEATVLVLPSREEPHAIVIGEALGHGLPVISTRGTGGAQTRLRDHENGLLVDSESPDQLAAATIELLSNPEASWAMGNSARNVILDTSTPHAVLERMLSALNSLDR
jgi:glycosyltransferase involved in cell wall biosynthesis